MQHKVLNSVCLTLWSRLKFESEEVIHGHAVLCTGEKHLKGHSWFWGPHVKKDIVNKAASPWRVPSRDLKRHQLIWCLGNAGRDLFVCLFVCLFPAAQSCPTLCDPMDCSMPGFPVLHCLLEFTQTHVH